MEKRRADNPCLCSQTKILKDFKSDRFDRIYEDLRFLQNSYGFKEFEWIFSYGFWWIVVDFHIIFLLIKKEKKFPIALKV